MISIDTIYSSIVDRTHTDIGTVRGILTDQLELQPVVFGQGRPLWGTENKASTTMFVSGHNEVTRNNYAEQRKFWKYFCKVLTSRDRYVKV